MSRPLRQHSSISLSVESMEPTLIKRSIIDSEETTTSRVEIAIPSSGARNRPYDYYYIFLHAKNILNVSRRTMFWRPVTLTGVTMMVFLVAATVLMGLGAWYTAGALYGSSIDNSSIRLRRETLCRVKSQFTFHLQRHKDASAHFGSLLSTIYREKNQMRIAWSQEFIDEIAALAWSFFNDLRMVASSMAFVQITDQSLFSYAVVRNSTPQYTQMVYTEAGNYWAQTVDNDTGMAVSGRRPYITIDISDLASKSGLTEFIAGSAKSTTWAMVPVQGEIYPALTAGSPVFGPDGRVSTGITSVSSNMNVVTSYLGQTGLKGVVMYVGRSNGELIASSREADFLQQSEHGARVMNATESSDLYVQTTAKLLEMEFGLPRLTKESISLNSVNVMGVNSYVSTTPLKFDNLNMYLAIIVPRETIMGPINDQMRQMILVFAFISISIILVAIFLVFIITNYMSVKMRPTEEVLRQKQMAEFAQAASEIKSQFLANISHDLRTPMAGIMGLVDILLCDSLTSSQKSLLSQLRICCETLLTLLNNLLDHAKVEAGKMQLEEVEFDIVRELEALVDRFSSQSIARGTEISLDLSDHIDRIVIGDPTRLRQVFINLLSNACKFTENGHINVRGWSRDDASEKQTLDEGDEAEDARSSEQSHIVHAGRTARKRQKVHLEFEVEDTGPGIPINRRSQIFEQFQPSAGPIVVDKHRGLGLGLGIVRAMVHLMGGHVALIEKEGTGASFRFDLFFSKQVEQIPSSVSADVRQEQGLSNLEEGRMNGYSQGTQSNGHKNTHKQTFKKVPSTGLVLMMMKNDSSNAAVALKWFSRHNFRTLHVSSIEQVLSALSDSSRLASEAADVDISMPSGSCKLALLDTCLVPGIRTSPCEGGKQLRTKLRGNGFEVVWLVEQNVPDDVQRALHGLGGRILLKPLYASRLSQIVSHSMAEAERNTGTGPDSAAESNSALSRCHFCKPPNETTHAGDQQPKDVLRGRTILVVDDNEVLRKIARTQLMSMGCKVHVACDGKEALDLIQASHAVANNSTSSDSTSENFLFDAVLMDCQMPIMDGYEACAAIRELEKKKGTHLPILALTANADEAEVKRCLAAGMDASFTKPIDKPALTMSLSHLILKYSPLCNDC